MAMNGANVRGVQTEFRVWAPAAQKVKLRLLDRSGGHPQDLVMKCGDGGIFTLTADATPGDRYFYLIDDDPLQMPDPVSRLLPDGVHGPTEIVDPDAYSWSDEGWRGIRFADAVFYELHVGTFSPDGTFDGVIEKLDYLKRLGIMVIELMPVAAFPGTRNWGYDGVSMYAVQKSYGGPEGLKRLVDAAHRQGLAVVLDVVYNHLGNEGNYLARFGPYFTSKHQTPWGNAVNFDDKGSEGVRSYVVENALYWIREYHLDGLRMDAVHAIKDDSRAHVLAELRDSVQQFAQESGREVMLIAETDENSPRYVKTRNEGGYGLDGIWSDDFHHALHTILTGEKEGYYLDFGDPKQLARAIEEGFAFQGEHFKFWDRARGESSKGMPVETHVICIQNHDQVGNRALGERLTELVSVERRKAMAAILLLAPETPLIFMGQESDETAPFQFFTDYGDPNLQKAVSEGRRNEFKEFKSFGEEFPDPQDEATFERSKLNWQLTPKVKQMLMWYQSLICLRKVLYGEVERSCRASANEGGLEMRVPAENPKLHLKVSWTGEAQGDKGDGWTEVLDLNGPDCNLRIRATPEMSERFMVALANHLSRVA